MAFDIEQLREAIGDEKFGDLKKHVEDLIGQRDTARKESIEGRKALKAEAETLRAFQAKVLDKFGLETPDALDEMPDPGVTTEAAKVLETRVKRLEAELKAKGEQVTQLETKQKSTLLEAALAKAVSAHEFVDRELVGSYIKSRIEWDGDNVLFKTDDGQVVALDEGVRTLAAARPHLVKAAGSGGSGYTPGAGSSRQKPFAEMTLTEKGELYKKDPTLYEQLSKQSQPQ